MKTDDLDSGAEDANHRRTGRPLAEAGEAMQTTERPVLLHEGLRLIVQREAARRLIQLGGTMPDASLPPRRRSNRARPARSEAAE